MSDDDYVRVGQYRIPRTPLHFPAEPAGELRERLREDLTGYLLQFSGRDVDPTDADCHWIANEVNDVLALPAVAALLAKLQAYEKLAGDFRALADDPACGRGSWRQAEEYVTALGGTS